MSLSVSPVQEYSLVLRGGPVTSPDTDGAASTSSRHLSRRVRALRKGPGVRVGGGDRPGGDSWNRTDLRSPSVIHVWGQEGRGSVSSPSVSREPRGPSGVV